MKRSVKIAGFTVLLLASGVCAAEAPPTGKPLHGNVYGRQGSVGMGEVTFTDADGNEVASTTINTNGSYHVVLPKNAKYPLLLTAKPGVDAKSSMKEIKGYALDQHVEMTDISPTTTKVVEAAGRLGGLTRENLIGAARLGLMSLQGTGGGGGGGGHAGH